MEAKQRARELRDDGTKDDQEQHSPMRVFHPGSARDRQPKTTVWWRPMPRLRVSAMPHRVAPGPEECPATRYARVRIPAPACSSYCEPRRRVHDRV